MARIASIKAYPENLGLSEPYAISSGIQREANYVVVVAKDADGARGYGEASPMPGYGDETQVDVLQSIQHTLGPAVVRDQADGVTVAIEAMDRATPGANMAKSAVEMALTDLEARKLGLTVMDYLGGRVRDSVEVAGGIGFMDPKRAAQKTRQIVAEGTSTIKVKIGRSLDEDIELVRAVRKEAGKDVGLRLDANQGYARKSAITNLKRLEVFEPSLFEQPVGRDDIKTMARITKAIETPIMADEPILTPLDVMEYANAGAADLVKVKLNKCGGFRKTLQLCETARLFGIKVVIGSGHESSIGVAAEAALAMSNSNFHPVGEMNGNQRLLSEWVDRRVFPSGGSISSWDAPGLGIAITVRPPPKK